VSIFRVAPPKTLSTSELAAPDYAIDAQGLGVRYNLRLTRQTTVRTSFKNLLKRPEGPTHFWALRDVTFRVVPGESLAIIGPNGAGKSTLLQVLAGIIQPNEGSVDVVGHISSLLTLGAGFDQDLSGRDNIRLAGAFLGIPHKVMEDQMPGIVEFADIGEFIDASIKTYSSGMRARLGFSIATAVDPDVLIIDEVLSTGDAVFRAKSKQRIVELTKAAKGIVLVTHDMAWVTEFCNRAMLLDHGHVIKEGPPAEVVALHQERSERARIAREEELAGKIAAVEGAQPTPAG
jgi:ABC-type polysaccharide/polyol phosphate transport system ATPase subunit